MKKVIKISLIITLILLILGSLMFFIFINDIMGISKVKFDKEKLVAVNQEIVLFDNNDNVLQNSVYNKNVISIEEVPASVINAFTSIEDKKFFEHKGLNYKRIAKAMLNNSKSMQFKEGASTISQQLIKNTHLTSEKTIKRKVKEILLTKKLEKEFSKKDILETYLNVIYFGENSYGIERASQTYFGKNTKDLEIWEAATLAGIIKSPYTYSPVYNKENCIKRRNLVLSEMLKDKKITPSQYEEAVSAPLEIIGNKNINTENNLYVKASILEAENILNMSEKDIRLSGIKIYTYLDNEQQNNMYKIVNNLDNYHVNKFGNINDSLLVLIDNKTYGITAFCGRSDYNLVNFKRQPGSAIKPILVYAPALENGLISPDTLILDEEVDYYGYKPKNLGGKTHGYVSITKSICDSLNIPAVKVLDYVGIEKAKNFASLAGIEFNEHDNGLAIGLGGFTEGVTLKDLTNSFVAFANNGKFSKASFVKKIVDKNGKTLYEHNLNEKQIMGEDTAYLMTSMLKESCKTGTSMKLKDLDFDVAGKTGTVAIKGTNNNTDAYSIAYTTNHTMGVWIGNYTNKPEFVLEGKNNGGTYATQMLKQGLQKLYENNKPKNFEKPDSVVEINYDLKAYDNEHVIKLASVNCPDRYIGKTLVAKRFTPKETSKLFDDLTVKNFDVKLKGNIAEITFDANDYLKYEIMRIENGKSKSLKKISNKNENITFYDNTLDYNKKYSYYILVTTINDTSSSVSETITILTNKKEESLNRLIEQTDNISWMFR